MRALTLHRPWARYVANGEKRIENRIWAPPAKMLGETIAIHAGKHWASASEDYIDRVLERASRLDDHPEGILGTARIVGWFDLDEGEDVEIKYRQRAIATQLETLMFGRFSAGDHSEWLDLTRRDRQWSFGPVCWVLRDFKPIAKPIPIRGFQKLWNVPPAEQALLDAALKEVA